MNVTSQTITNTPVTITFSVQGDPNRELTASIVSPPSNGQLSGINQSLGTVTYTPNPGFNGAESLYL